MKFASLEADLGGAFKSSITFFLSLSLSWAESRRVCYDIKPVRKEEGKSYWKIPLCDDDATREK